MATDANTLLAAVKCYECLAPGQWQLLKLALLKQTLLALNSMSDTSVNTLLASVKCYECLAPGQWPLLELALLQQIAAGVGTGGVLCGTTDPPVAAPTNNCSMYYKTTENKWWYWDGAAWQPAIS